MAAEFLERIGRRSEATRGTYACALDAFARCFDVELVDLLTAKIKSSELDAYSTLDKFVGWLTGNGAAPKTIWTYVSAVKSILGTQHGKCVQIHHIDGSHSNNDPGNLAALCLDCHSEVTGTRGLERKIQS